MFDFQTTTTNRRKDTIHRVMFWHALEAPEDNTLVRSLEVLAWERFSYTNTPVFYQLMAWPWPMSLRKLKSLVPKFIMKVMCHYIIHFSKRPPLFARKFIYL